MSCYRKNIICVRVCHWCVTMTRHMIFMFFFQFQIHDTWIVPLPISSSFLSTAQSTDQKNGTEDGKREKLTHLFKWNKICICNVVAERHTIMMMTAKQVELLCLSNVGPAHRVWTWFFFLLFYFWLKTNWMNDEKRKMLYLHFQIRYNFFFVSFFHSEFDNDVVPAEWVLCAVWL